MGTKSLRDFAEENGVTLRAIQKHIKKYESELKDHMVRYGPPRGTYIDDVAQEIIAAHLVKDPIAVMDTTLAEEVERLRGELEEANKRIIALLEEKASLAEKVITAEATKAIAETTARDQAAKVQELEGKLTEAEDETKKLKGRSLWQRIIRWGE